MIFLLKFVYYVMHTEKKALLPHKNSINRKKKTLKLSDKLI